MEILVFIFIAVVVIAVKAGKTAAKGAAAARGTWSVGEAALRRLKKQRNKARRREAQLRERWASIEANPPEPPPIPDALEQIGVQVEEEVRDWRDNIWTDPSEDVVDVEAAEAITILEEQAVADDVLESSPAPVHEEPALEEPVQGAQPWPEPEPVASVEEDPMLDLAPGDGPVAPVEAPVEPAVEPEPESVSDPSPAAALTDPYTLSSDLFAEGRPGFEIQRLFERDHKGDRVHWRAVVDRVETSSAGTRLVAEVAPAEPSARRLRVEVDLPPGAPRSRSTGSSRTATPT